ncbi:MAG: hypothetical protein EZS28_030813 [Streblomastix strix]|uniref:Uncharacterized protein n=1 Tax=Streblomastix strix TaxID=222440 RepID=A0A5J4UTE0_9EUKA|nr:MAG: hypothetical protein EZS28_030813 [Streblomastix strix]
MYIPPPYPSQLSDIQFSNIAFSNMNQLFNPEIVAKIPPPVRLLHSVKMHYSSIVIYPSDLIDAQIPPPDLDSH